MISSTICRHGRDNLKEYLINLAGFTLRPFQCIQVFSPLRGVGGGRNARACGFMVGQLFHELFGYRQGTEASDIQSSKHEIEILGS